MVVPRITFSLSLGMSFGGLFSRVFLSSLRALMAAVSRRSSGYPLLRKCVLSMIMYKSKFKI